MWRNLKCVIGPLVSLCRPANATANRCCLGRFHGSFSCTWCRALLAANGPTSHRHICCYSNLLGLRSGQSPAGAQECGLTLPSRGRLQSGFAALEPPLMSNVRPRRVSRTTRAFVRRRAAGQESSRQRCRAAVAHLLRPAIRPLPLRTARQREATHLCPHAHAFESPGKEPKSIQSAATFQAPSKRWSVRGRRCGGTGEAGALTVTCRFGRSGRAVVASPIHELRRRGLTLPSRGRATSGFASCRPPLMSNVSRHGTHRTGRRVE